MGLSLVNCRLLAHEGMAGVCWTGILSKQARVLYVLRLVTVSPYEKKRRRQGLSVLFVSSW